MLDIIAPRSYKAFNDVYLVMDCMDSDMRALLKTKQSLPEKNIQYFLYNVLRGVSYLHSADVLHRDIVINCFIHLPIYLETK